MKSKLSLLLTMLMAGLWACQPTNTTPPASVLTSEIKDFKSPEALIVHIENGILDTLKSGMDEAQSLSLNLDKEIILNLQEGYQNSYIYLKPGDTLSLGQGAKGEVSLFAAEPRSKENQYLYDVAKTTMEAEKGFQLFQIAGQKVDSFLISLDKKYESLEKLSAEIAADTEISDYFKKALALRIKATKMKDKMMYESYYKYITKEDAEVPEDFLAELDSKFYDDPLLLVFEEGRTMGGNLNGKNLNFEDMEGAGAFFNALYAETDKDFQDPDLRSYFKSQALEQQINFGSGLDGADELIASFKTDVKNPYLLQKLEAVVKPWENIRKGMDAPDFSGVTRDGKMVKLSDLKGKSVYVDVWATWCGPCIQEIPSLKQLEKDMHGRDVEFVSISIDEQDSKQKWMDFVKKESLGGTQIMAENAWKSEVATSYNIQGIPRFLFIDSEGKIISANAPRPSSSETKTLIESNS
ncbi:MAG: TlpA disulfide reductase family protein [Bacteroidota bacterium]